MSKPLELDIPSCDSPAHRRVRNELAAHKQRSNQPATRVYLGTKELADLANTTVAANGGKRFFDFSMAQPAEFTFGGLPIFHVWTDTHCYVA